VRAHHYCTHLTEGVRQCVIYDSDQPGARLIGVEYIISRGLYEVSYFGCAGRGWCDESLGFAGRGVIREMA